MTPSENIRANLRWLRKQYNLSQEQLATILEVTRSRVGAWEEGRARPQYEHLIGMADHFKVTMDELLRVDIRTKICEDERCKNDQGAAESLRGGIAKPGGAGAAG